MLLPQRDMTSMPASAPLVRPLPSRRASRLRFSWFVLGSLFGAALSYFILTTVRSGHEPQFSRDIRASGAYAFSLLESAISQSSHPSPLTSPPASASASAPVAAVTTAVTSPTAVLAKAAAAPYPAHVNLSVHRGDTMMSMLTDKGIAYEEAYHIVESMKRIYNPKRLTVGQSMELHLDKSKADKTKPSLTQLSIAVSPLKTISLSRTANDSFTTKEVKAEVVKEIARGGGTITSSLYQTGIDSGVPPQLLGEVINALAYDIDFQRDIKEGDRLDVIYERMHTDKNVSAGYGNVLYASLRLADREIALYRHVTNEGFSGFYTAKGESVKKALLKTPINGAHITSGFGMRMHPLLGYTKMHKGVDFGAVTGTPIFAAGDGIVEEAGVKGGYGNYVRLRHSATYETAYGHASRFARGIHAGAHVKQGQVIAYVGATGHATGPHLHFEILANGSQVNPAGVKFRTGQTLAGHELAAFKREISQVQTALNMLPQKTQVADLSR